MVLFDGIYDGLDDDLFICPIREPQTQAHQLFNLLQRRDRSIIENKFGRQQQFFPIIALPFTLDPRLVGIVYRCCVILTNIIIGFQSPLRKEF